MRIQLNRLSKEFASARGSTFASKEIDLEIREGEFFVLLGPSGCGKSTVLNLIAGLEKPTGGEIRFGDRVVASAVRNVFIPPAERNIAMVFQSYALYPHLSVYGNIAFPLEIAKEDKKTIRKAVDEVASMLGITDLLPVRPGQLSGGQRQRVAIARALVRHPSVFLMDEPLSNLDAQLRASTRTELKALQRRLGITTVYVTHDQVEAMSLGDRIAVLRGGRLEQAGSPEELYGAPVNTFVAAFIASPPMNLLRIAIENEAEERTRPGTALEDGDVRRPGRLIRTNGGALRAPGDVAALFDGLKPGEWILGMRPEHIHIRPSGGGAELSDRETGGRTLRGEVQVVEPTGREILLHVAVGTQKLLILTEERRYAGARPGEILDVEPDLKRAYVFSTSGEMVRAIRRS